MKTILRDSIRSYARNNAKAMPQLRQGQNLLVAAMAVCPDFHMSIISTSADPFYLDQNIGKFWEEVDRWDATHID